MKARTLLVLPVLAAVLITGACQGGGNTANPGGEPTLSQSDAVDINFQPRENLAQGGELRLSVGDIQDQWNGAQAEGNTLDTADMLSPLLPSLYYTNESGVPTWDPDYLASEPKAVVADGKLTVTYDLNPKAVWGDGTAISLEDFEASWKALNGSNKEFSPASTEGYDQITSVTQGASEQQIVVAFKATYPDWTALFGGQGLFRAESVATPDAFNNGWKKGPKPAWLAGPFIIDSITPNLVTEVPNPDWWGDKPLLDKVTWRTIATDATPNAFVNGEIDAFDIGPDPNGFNQAKGVADATVRKAAGPNWRHITFNSKAGVLKDEKVRQALVKGLDRTSIGASDLAGIDWPVSQLNNGIILSNQQGYEDEGKATGIDYNVEGAKSDLDALGWKAGSDGIREKDGKKLEVKFSALDGVPASQNEALQTQNQLKSIGVKVDIVNVSADAFNTTLSNHSFEMIAFTWIGTPFPYANINQLYGTGSDSNYQQLSLPDVDKLTAQIKVETDPAQRTVLANQAAQLLWKSVGIVPLYQRPELIAVKSKIANYGAFGLSSPQWQNIGFQK